MTSEHVNEGVLRQADACLLELSAQAGVSRRDGLTATADTLDGCAAVLKRLRNFADAALASTAGAGAGDWVTVPREPTMQMGYAADKARPGVGSEAWGPGTPVKASIKHGERIYRAMIEASPAVPASARSGGWQPTDKIMEISRKRLRDIQQAWADHHDLDEGNISFLLRMAGCYLREAPAVPASARSGAGEGISRKLLSAADDRSHALSCVTFGKVEEDQINEKFLTKVEHAFLSSKASTPAPAGHGVEIPDLHDARHAAACRAADAELREWEHRGMLRLDGLTLGLSEAVAVAVMNALSQVSIPSPQQGEV